MSRVRRFLGRHPFAILGVVTMVIGGVWHSGIVPGELRMSLTPVITAIGWPFIAAMRFVNRSTDWPMGVTSLVGTLLGLSPYLLADWALRRWRARRSG